MPLYCPRCQQVFLVEDNRDEHILHVSCAEKTGRPDGVTEFQKKQSAKRPPSSQTPAEQWYAVFDVLFPGCKTRTGFALLGHGSGASCRSSIIIPAVRRRAGSSNPEKSPTTRFCQVGPRGLDRSQSRGSSQAEAAWTLQNTQDMTLAAPDPLSAPSIDSRPWNNTGFRGRPSLVSVLSYGGFLGQVGEGDLSSRNILSSSNVGEQDKAFLTRVDEASDDQMAESMPDSTYGQSGL